VNSTSGNTRWRRGGVRKSWRRVALMNRSRPDGRDRIRWVEGDGAVHEPERYTPLPRHRAGGRFHGGGLPGRLHPGRHQRPRQDQSASFTFTAANAGTYRIACLVPGREDAGMWDVLEVVASGTPAIATG
jgi:hypothetical protein